MTPAQRDDLLMALALLRGAIEDVPAGTLPNASMRFAADLIQGVYDATRGGNVIPFPAGDFSVKVPAAWEEDARSVSLPGVGAFACEPDESCGQAS